MRAGTPKDVLNRLKWKDRLEDWGRVDVVIRHHGAPGDRKRIRGARITDLGNSFFEIDGETSIPYHRVQEIRVDDAPVYVRAASSAKRS